MKKVFTLTVSTFLLALFLSGCVKENVQIIDESYWLSKERGDVVYSSSSCSYFIVETYYGYNVLRMRGGNRPYEYDVVYGNFSNYGIRDFYDRSGRFIFTAEVVEYWLNYSDAQDALNYYCQ